MTAVRASRILLTVPVVLAAILAAICAAHSVSEPAPITATLCAPMPADISYLGPPLTTVEIAAISDSQDWAQLKRRIRPGDTIHQFSLGAYFGYAVLRGECFIGKVTEGVA